jgi:KipI family sensor histidine kinase inhibitor
VTAPHDEAGGRAPRDEPASHDEAPAPPHDAPPGLAGERWRWQLVGDDAVLVDLPDAATVARVGAALRAAPPPGVVDVVPAAVTVLIRGSARGRDSWAPAVRRVAEGSSGLARGAALGPDAPRLVEIPVVYDGDDLADVARLADLSADEVVERHVAGLYRVAFGGFMPGFAYLTGLDPALVVPRLATPRTRVPAGAVAIAGEYAAVYPRATPGGWRLLGRTGTVLFDPAHDERPALLAPGDEVRFVPARERVVAGVSGGVHESPSRAAEESVGTSTAVIEVLATGPLLLVEDAGRPGLAAVGVPRSGAADPAALRAANRLVGNRADAAVLEVVLGGLVVRFGATTAFALVGAMLGAELDGRPVTFGRAERAPAGATLELGAPMGGLRTWLAVRGGVDVRPVLGSRSTDVLSGLGPAPVAVGDFLAIGSAFEGLPEVEPGADEATSIAVSSTITPTSDEATAPDEGPDGVVVLPATRGPRLDRLDEASRERLVRQEWIVTPDSNRVALRLNGTPLVRADDQELPSEGLVLGAVQVPHDGRPVIFGPDHPVTGGYPVVAILTAEGITRMARRRPGDRVRLVIRDR